MDVASCCTFFLTVVNFSRNINNLLKTHLWKPSIISCTKDFLTHRSNLFIGVAIVVLGSRTDNGFVEITYCFSCNIHGPKYGIASDNGSSFLTSTPNAQSLLKSRFLPLLCQPFIDQGIRILDGISKSLINGNISWCCSSYCSLLS